MPSEGMKSDRRQVPNRISRASGVRPTNREGTSRGSAQSKAVRGKHQSLQGASHEWCGEATEKRWYLSESGRWCRLESWGGEEYDAPPEERLPGQQLEKGRVREEFGVAVLL